MQVLLPPVRSGLPLSYFLLIVACGQSDAVGDIDTGAGGDADGSVQDADASVDAAPLADASVDASSFPGVTDLTEDGPFPTNGPSGDDEGPDCIIHRPVTLGEGGLRHPVIIWGMGTGGFNTYSPMFDLWASHGFIVAAAKLGDGQGDGAEMLACLDYVCDEYAPDVDCRAGASGHSQGGGGAIMAAQDPRVVTTAPIQPYIAQGFGGFDQASIANQTGPMLLLSGGRDTIASPAEHQAPVYAGANVPVLWANLIDGDHVATGINGAAGYRSIALGWFRVQLMGDSTFRGMFYAPDCEVCSDSAWEIQPAKGL